MLKIFSYWWLPIVGGCIWWGMLIAMIVCWVAKGRPHYEWMPAEQTFPYISYIGATTYGKPIFIACAASQGVLLVLSLAAERYLRHAGRLLPNHRKREKVLAGLAIALATIGSLGILFVSIFDCVHYDHVHYSMLVIFIVFIGLSSICTIWEFCYLDRRNKEYIAIKVSTAFKCIWFVVELACAIAFASSRHHRDVSSAFEWAVSFIYPFYSLCLAFDLAPAHGTRKGEFLQYAKQEIFHEDPYTKESGESTLNASHPQNPVAQFAQPHAQLYTPAQPQYPAAAQPAEPAYHA